MCHDCQTTAALEGLVLFVGAIAAYAMSGGSWVLFIVLLLAPDLAMLGYAVNVRVGALTYNSVHNYLLPALLLALGYVLNAFGDANRADLVRAYWHGPHSRLWAEVPDRVQRYAHAARLMPYPAQITRDAVIGKARELIEAEGLEQVSLSRLAAALNVKAPSLYRYFEGKGDLLRAVNEVTQRTLIDAIGDAVAQVETHEPAGDGAMAQAYRAFGQRFPVSFGLPTTRTTALRSARMPPKANNWRCHFSR